jgi:hypothetical protein
MRSLYPVVPLALLASIGAQIVGCNSMNSVADRRLQAITLSPTTATGHDSSDGQVQFVATGSFTSAPTPVTPLQASSWLVSDPGVASVSTIGLAQCRPGTIGTVTVKAIASGGSDMMGTATVVTGTAQLICP